MSGKRVKKVDCSEILNKKENKDLLDSYKDIRESDDGAYKEYCALTNRRCGGKCAETNKNKVGVVECSELMSSRFLPKKRNKRRKRRRNADQSN